MAGGAASRDEVREGPASAAVLSAGIGVFVTGLVTTLAEVSPPLKAALVWSDAVGPLSGKTGLGVIAWLAAWALLHLLWRRRDRNFSLVYRITLWLVTAGFLLTFPPVFEAFMAE